MKIVKPAKLPVLHRVVEIARRPYFHVAGVLAFPLHSPRALLDELSFWQQAAAALGENGVIDEGFAKARAELLVGGAFFSPGGKPVTASFVRVRLGSIDKRLAVVGDRAWHKDVPTDPEPFTSMPLTWTRAFGGAGFDRNPHGKGAAPVTLDGRPVHPLPNIETYGQMMRSPNERPEPAGFLPMDVTFAQRRARAGTIDKRYLEEWFPGMPGDMDPAFFNVAPEDQWLSGPPPTAQPAAGRGPAGPFFRGDEELLIENMHPEQPRIEGRLPGLSVRVLVTQWTGRGPRPAPAPAIPAAPAHPAGPHPISPFPTGPFHTASSSAGARPAPSPFLEGDRFIEIPMRCDTVWLFPSIGMGAVLFHGAIPVAEDDAADIVHLVAACEDPAAPRPVEHYRRALALRLDKDRGALRDMSDSDLMPPKESGVQANLRLSDFDVGRWTRSENIAMKRARKGQERQLEQARARLLAEGLDPKDYGVAELPPAPEEPPLDDLDALAEYMESQMAGVDEQRTSLERRAEEAREQARKAFAEMGKDFDAEMARAEKEGGGPPKFSAVEHLARLSAMAADAAAEGVAAPEMERHLADPRTWEEIKAQEDGLREMYRKFAHLQPAAAAMDSASSDRVRVLVELARDNDESLAGRDFTGARLAGMDLRGIDLSGAFLEGADLSGCALAGASLVNAVLARADLRGAGLEGAQLTGANLGGADLSGARLDDAEMSGCVLARASLSGARLPRARLEGADWLEARPGAVDLSGAALGQGTFLKVDLSGARFTGADLSDATFVECQLDEADFSEARMVKTTFVGCRGASVAFRRADLKQAVFVHGSLFPEADFSGAALDRANLRGTLLEGARFDGAALDGADLSECDASRASFDEARMRGGLLIRTRLAEASLRGADLMDALASKTRIAGADFSGASLYRADLSRAVRDAATSFGGANVERVRTLPKADAPAKEAS